MISNTTTPFLFLVYILIFFVAIVIRYFIAAGIFYWYYFSFKKEIYKTKHLSNRKLRKNQIKKEISWSIKSSLIFAAVGAITFYLWQQGFTAIYLPIETFGIWYLPLSLLIILLIHETYYYWVHRWMHHPKIFKVVHRVHHDSFTPTPWTAFSFHPWESLIEALILPFILIFLPVNIYVLIAYLLIMTVSSVINHLDIELFSKKFRRGFFGKQLIGATHHNFHHEEYKTNYGLYFTFWDRWMGTESKKMDV